MCFSWHQINDLVCLTQIYTLKMPFASIQVTILHIKTPLV